MNSDRTTYNPVYGSLLLAIFGFGVLSLLYMAAGSVQLESQDTQDAQMYTTISQNISVPTESETLIPIQEVQEPVCKAGYNPGSELDQNAITTAAGKFGSTVTVITARDFSRTASFISSANDNQLLPIIRLCYKNADPNHCSDFKSPGDTADFIVSLANNLDPDEQFVFIAGPNEPISERWVTQNTAILDSDAVPIDTTPRFLAYFQEVGRYTRQVAIEVNSQLTDQPELRDQISVIGPIWNMDYHGCGNRTEFIASFIEGLGGDLGILDGMGGNTYNVNGIQADQCFDPIYENFINGNVPSDFEFHVTEFGPFGADQKNGLKEAYDALAANPYVSTINFFTPFAEDGSEYERHQLSQSEIDTISQCDISLEDPAPEEEEPIVEDVREVPYAVYYEEAFAPYEMQTCERIDSSDQVSGWHRLVPVGTGGAYEGYQIITAQVESFPQLNHFGAAEPFEPDLSRNSFGNRDFPPTPYDPICAVLSRTVGGGGFVSTHEHAGLVKFYGNNDEVVGEFALEKLGSGIGCLNLLSLLNPLSTEGFEGRDIREVYKGFDFVSLSELEQENSYDAGVNSVEVQISRVASELFIDSLTQFGDTIFKGFESLIGRFTGTFDRPLAENEPYAEY
ncbi:hypothetical protein KC717_05455, partial [Candidatus Dojkabacteria bacterium]|nr:hypothetical protein [Candidatus Dojkabacteria bacterium]